MRNFIAGMSHHWRIFTDDRSGATAIEYSLIASLISIVILLAVGLIGGSVQQLFNSVAVVL
jgi:pilus assembly protein Flp/PilA